MEIVSYKRITISEETKSIEEFIELRNNIATSPEGGVAMLILALKIYTENKELGHKCLVTIVDKSKLHSKKDVYKGFAISNILLSRIDLQLKSHPYLPNSYIDNSFPENSYTAVLPYNFYFKTNSYSGDETDGKIKIFVKCSGAASNRPVTLIRNKNGIWKAKEFNTLLSTVQNPVNKNIEEI